jgi:hypothetical protein
MTRKTATYRQLIEYFLKEQKDSISKADSFIIKHNIKGTTVDQWTKAFEANEAGRLIKRSNSVKLYHEVMSISDLDTSKISKPILQDLANKYIELRNPNSMCIAVPHYDKAHIHIHFCFSGTEIETGKSLRISKENFALFKKELQDYQIERYPALSHSIVKHGKKQKDRVKDKEYQLTKRTKAPSEREHIKQTVEFCYSKSLSQADFMHRLSERGLQTYSRNGLVTGIESDRKYRFGSLGYDEKKLGELNYRDEALKGIQVFRDEKDKDKEIETEVEMEWDVEDKNDTDYKEGRDEENNNVDEIDEDIDVEPDLDMDI